jgi:hypothetical protein
MCDHAGVCGPTAEVGQQRAYGRQLAHSRPGLIGDSDRHLTGHMATKPNLCREHGIINEFIAAPDAELALASVLRTFEPKAD